MTLYLVQAILVVALTIIAWLRGGGEHRLVATAIAAMFLFTSTAALTRGQASDWAGLPMHRAIMDVAAFALFYFAWLKSDKWWLLWVSSAQLLAVFAHLARVLELPLPALGYAVMEIWPTFFVLILLGAALYARTKQCRRMPEHF